MKLTALTTISPLDGRYRNKVEILDPYISEYALIKTRIEVESKYLIALSEIGIVRKLTKLEKNKLEIFGENFSLSDAETVKKIEQETRHDVKAMEKTFRKMLKGTSMEDLIEWIHFGLTSEDVNNLSYRLMCKRTTKNVLIPTLSEIVTELLKRAEMYKALPMLARTHGQNAVPTTVGKELVVFADRLQKQILQLSKIILDGKLSGAVGNFNAVAFTYPTIDWISFSEKFIISLGLQPNLFTTQINTYEDIASFVQNYQRINTILIDFNQDIWRYISDEWFVQTVKKGEVGSSTMPQKVNPIDFENSEGNLGLANTLSEYMARKLPISRLQRDLSDSTVMRNIGVFFGYSLVGYTSILTGLSRISIHEKKVTEVLETDWTILSEGVQTLLRSKGVSDPYSLIASLTRGKHITQKKWKKWINDLDIPQEEKKRIQTLTPKSYIGLSIKLTEKAIILIRKSLKNSHEK